MANIFMKSPSQLAPRTGIIVRDRGARAVVVEEKKEELKIGRTVAFLGFIGLIQMVAGAFALTLIYGVIVIIFRAAFHVELWNPFR